MNSNRRTQYHSSWSCSSGQIAALSLYICKGQKSSVRQNGDTKFSAFERYLPWNEEMKCANGILCETLRLYGALTHLRDCSSKKDGVAKFQSRTSRFFQNGPLNNPIVHSWKFSTDECTGVLGMHRGMPWNTKFLAVQSSREYSHQPHSIGPEIQTCEF